jgi:hypothetical protein
MTEFPTEWYDNSSLTIFDMCERKYYWSRIINSTGYTGHASIAMRYGECMHTALEIYYNVKIKDLTNRERRHAALRAFLNKYRSLIGDCTEVGYTIQHGVVTLERYFDFYAPKDELFTPVGSEMGFLFYITPRSHEDFRPIPFIIRTDGIFKQQDETFIIMETKVTKRPREMLQKVSIDRQPQGYVYGVRTATTQAVLGTLINVIGVYVNLDTREDEDLFHRDLVTCSPIDAEIWREETIAKVTRIRELAKKSHVQPHRVYSRSTCSCMSFNKLCEFYPMCKHNDPSIATAIGLQPNTWHPLKEQKP